VRLLGDLTVNDVTRPHDRWLLGADAFEDLDRVADRRERVAELVGEHRQKLVLAPRGLPELLHEVVELFDQVADLILASARVQRRLHRREQRVTADGTGKDRHVSQHLQGVQLTAPAQRRVRDHKDG
jgi:hypothetical protein